MLDTFCTSFWMLVATLPLTRSNSDIFYFFCLEKYKICEKHHKNMEFPHRSHKYYVHILYTRLEETYRYLFHIYTNAAELRGIYDNFLLTEEERNRGIYDNFLLTEEERNRGIYDNFLLTEEEWNRGIYDNFLLTEEERNRREVAITTDPQLVWSTFRGQKESSPRRKPH
jgi:hypothetical protein